MTPLEVIIRPASFSDIDDLTLLLKELFSIEEDFSFNESLQKKGLEMMLENREIRCIMAAEIQHKVVGMCSLQLVISTAEGGKAGLLEDLVVSAAYRGINIGKKLLKAVEQWARERGVSRIQLLADRNNLSGLEFYNKMEWTKTQLICLRKMI